MKALQKIKKSEKFIRKVVKLSVNEETIDNKQILNIQYEFKKRNYMYMICF